VHKPDAPGQVCPRVPRAVFAPGTVLAADFWERFVRETTILRCKRDIAIAGVIAKEDCRSYEWSAELLPGEGEEPGEFRVRANIRSENPALPRMLHFDGKSLAFIAEGGVGVRACLRCGRPVRAIAGWVVHLDVDGEVGPDSCRAASKLWDDGVDLEIPARFRAE
jgi:hypothetical protein